MIDDSALFHAGTYDPAKAHEYYLRNRKLKGRVSRLEDKVSSRPSSTRTTSGSAGGKPNRADTKSRQAQLRAEKEALEKRLDRLRDVLKELVDAAKKRSGGNPNKKDDEKGKAPETQADKADRNKDQKKDKPETAAQKKEKAKKAKEAYEKEHPTSLSQDIDVLQSQVEDIQHKIKQALADARERRNKAGSDGKNRPAQDHNNSGPRGR
jgi:chromosome segregation ATPase